MMKITCKPNPDNIRNDDTCEHIYKNHLYTGEIFTLTTQAPVHIQVIIVYSDQKVSPTWLNIRVVVTLSQVQRIVGVVVNQ